MSNSNRATTVTAVFFAMANQWECRAVANDQKYLVMVHKSHELIFFPGQATNHSN
jgi:hypothetical protein